MDECVVDLLIKFAKEKDSIQIEMPPPDDLLFVEKFNSEINVIKKLCSVALIQ